MKERQIDRGIRSWAARLANRRDTKRIVVWILAVAVLAAFALVALGALFGAALALAAAPDYRFGAQTLGWKDPLWKPRRASPTGRLFKRLDRARFMWLLSRPKIRDWLTSSEYNEAIALRGRYVKTGGELVETSAGMSVGEAIYIYGVIFLDKLVALWLATLIVYASVG